MLHAYSGDLIFLFYQRYSSFVGKLCITFSQVIYGRRLKVEKPFKVWGWIRFLMLGDGFIKIGANFHCVSNRKRSVITLFSPCHLTVIDQGQILIGNNVGLNGTTIVSKLKVSIGNNSMIGPNTIIVDHDSHSIWPPTSRWNKQGVASEIIIENDVWIGMNCIILKGVKVGNGSVVAAGSIVLKDVEPNSLYAGNPAVKIKTLF
jgi:acetyltransferase-like isoleucine patch superfamily enzyme